MLVSKTSLMVAVFLVAAFFTSCVEDKDYGEANNLRPNVNREVDTNTNQNVADDDEQKLDKFINLPFEPIEPVFREESVESEPAEKNAVTKERRLIVVFKFSPEDSVKLVEKAKSAQVPFETKVDAEPWFPAELIAKSGTSGSDQLNGTGYSAKDFLKAPWTTGSLIKINDTEFFVLILQTS